MITTLATSIAYAVASLIGLAALWFSGRWMAGWINEVKGPAEVKEVTEARKEADESDQDLNNQINKLP